MPELANTGDSQSAEARFQFVAVLGGGTQGQVLRVRDRVRDLDLALKAVPGADPASLVAEFARLSAVAHPALPRVFDVGVLATACGPAPAGTPYFTSELVPGRSLAELGALDAAGRWAVAVDVAGALAAIHAAGLVHRDVAPQNVLVAGAGREVRAFLLDLGLASARGGDDGAARGTLAFLAPEALAGRAAAAGDLYGLGACLFFAVRGRAPVGGEGAALLEAVLRAPRPRLDDAETDGLGGLIESLLALDPTRRAADAVTAWEMATAAHAALPSELAPPLRPMPAPTWSRAGAWPAADRAAAAVVERVRDARAGRPGPIVVVAGAPGAEVRAVVERALRQEQIAAAARVETAVVRPESALALRLGRLDDLAPPAPAGAAGADDHRARAVATAALAAAATAAATVTVLDATDDERAGAIAAAAAGLRGPGAVIVALEVEGATPDDAHVLTPLTATELIAALGPLVPGAADDDRAADDAWRAALHAATRGLPPVAERVARALAAEGRDPRTGDPRAAATLGPLAVRTLAAAPPGAAAAALALALWRAPVDGARLAASTDGDVARAEAALAWLAARGLIVRGADGAALAPSAAEAILAGAAPQVRARAADRVAAVARAAGLSYARWATALVYAAAPAAERAAAAAEALGRGAPAQALALLTVAAPETETSAAAPEAAPSTAAPETETSPEAPDTAPSPAAPDTAPSPAAPETIAATAEVHALLLARAAMVLGDYARAEAALARTFLDPDRARAARLLGARAAQRAGALDRAEVALSALVAEAPHDPRAVGPWARLAIARGRYRDAVDALLGLGPVPADAAGALCAEARATAHLYLGERADAEAHARVALAIATGLDDEAQRGRALILHGMLAQADDDLVGAAAHYRAAAIAARAGGDGHTAAVAEQNRAAALAERGLHGDALPALSAAAAELTALGRVAELGAVEANRAVSLLALGQLAAAATAAASARVAADAAGVPVARFYATLVDGDVARRRGDRAGSAAAYRSAWALAVAAALPDRGHAQRALAEVEDGAAAVAAVAAAAALDRDDHDRDYTALARARLRLRELGDEAPGPLGDELASLADRAERSGRLDRAWRARHLAGALAQQAGDAATAAARRRAAHTGLAELTRHVPEAWRSAAMTDPDVRALASATASLAPMAAPAAPAVTAELARLRRLLTLARRLTAETDLPRLLAEVLDTAVELTQAERGFVVLRDADGALAIAASRGFAADKLTDGAISRSVADRAITTGEPVITVDAGHDQRFDGAASIAALHLRSVIAVPLFARGQVIGCLYVDHRVRVGAFDDVAADGLVELAAIAAVAIDTARLIAAARDDAAAIAALNAQLAAEIADRDAALAIARAAIPTRPRGPGLDALIGDSAEMTAVVALIERAAQVALPVAIVGESGTGKELCARAVHQAGPRRDRPFIAINCGALPEPLLETELFGHARGAFTGAERERQGLFEIAHGGTLFLDEIADTSPAMQAKLLRVVQDGEVRRVGGDHTRKVDVRLVSASRVPLGELVAAGRFRDDLRFRLDVIAITMPPLRARAGDLPALVGHLLGRIAGARPPRVSREAARAIARYPWPGNVRELENALARAVALGSDPITVDDLPEPVRGTTPTPPRAPTSGELTLKPAVEALERTYVEAALTRSRGNQSAAARLLGLSRFGLQKKLRRLGLGPER